MKSRTAFTSSILLASLFFLVACSNEEEASTKPGTPVTQVIATTQQVETLEASVGRLQARTAPNIAAETAGRVVDVLVKAGDRVESGQVLARLDGDNQRALFEAARGEVLQLQALANDQQKRADRLAGLVEKQLISSDQHEQAQAQAKALNSQLASAQANLSSAQLNLQRIQITSPIAGQIQARHVSIGDFVDAGQVMFEVVGSGELEAILPLPQRLASVLEVGQMVRLSSTSDKSRIVTSPITEIRPAVGARSRAVEAVVDVEDSGAWRSGESVRAEIVISNRQSVVVPPIAVVSRPIGSVVYVIDPDESVAKEQVVETGVKHANWTEILSGLESGQAVVVDGAGFLTDGAMLDITETLDGQAP